MKDSKRNKRFKVILRTSLGIGLLVYLILRFEPRKVFGEFSELKMLPLTLAFVAQIMAKIIWTVRWGEILSSYNMKRRYSDLLTWLFIGLFFNSFLPTAVGGDTVRGYYAAGKKENFGLSYLALFIERILGLITLACMATLASIAVFATGHFFVPKNVLILIIFFGFVWFLLGVLAFSWQGWLIFLGKLKFFSHKRLRQILSSLVDALGIFKSPGTRKHWILLNSFALQVVAVLFHVACARAVGLTVSIEVFFFIVPASVIAAMLPISLNGIGIREGVLVSLLSAAGADAPQSAAFALLALVISTLFSVLGGLVYLIYRNPEATDEGKTLPEGPDPKLS